MIFCSQCGQQLPDDARFCVKCGHKVRSTDVDNILTKEDPPSTTSTIKKSPLDPTDSQMLYASLTEYLGRHGDERLQIAPDISDKSLRTFLDRTSKHIDPELPLVLFDSSWGEDSPGGWLITNRRIYSDSFLKVESALLVDIDSIAFGRMENTLKCGSAKGQFELDFCKTNDLRIGVARFIEVMSGQGSVVNEKEAESCRDVDFSDKPTVRISLVKSSSSDYLHGELNSAMVCPHCQARGSVRTKSVKRKAGVSGGKLTGALLTGGISILATGLSRKQGVTEAYCGNCGSSWDF